MPSLAGQATSGWGGVQAGGVGGPDSRPAALHLRAGDGELAQVATSQLRRDCHLSGGPTVVVALMLPTTLGGTLASRGRVLTPGPSLSSGDASFPALRRRRAAGVG